MLVPIQTHPWCLQAYQVFPSAQEEEEKWRLRIFLCIQSVYNLIVEISAESKTLEFSLKNC